MAILRNKNRDKFTVVSNEILRNGNLNLKERGMLITLLSLPDNWEFSIKGLMGILPEGRDGIRAILDSLEAKGYLCRSRERDALGRLQDACWEIFESPQTLENSKELPESENPTLDEIETEKPKSENPTLDETKIEKPKSDNPTLENPTLEEPTLEKPMSGFPTLVNPPQYNTKQNQISNESNTNNNQLLNGFNTQSINLMQDECDVVSEEKRAEYEKIVKNNIRYDERKLFSDNGPEFKCYDRVYQVLIDTICKNPKDGYIWIAKKNRSIEEVRERLLRIREPHIQAVIRRIKQQNDNISKFTGFTATALYNIADFPADSLQDNRKVGFCNMMRHNYDIADIEAALTK